MKPRIGITRGPFMKTFELYQEGVRRAGGEPVTLDELPDLDQLDGILLTGGGDIHPRRYGEEIQPEDQRIDETRDELELQLAREAIGRHLPLFGICRGLQVLNVALGGSLQHHVEGHEAGVTHPIELLAGQSSVVVNSFHHQAVKEVAPGLSVAARSGDGVVEGLESEDGSIVAVQWHPERMLGQEAADRFFKRLVELASQR